MLSVTQLKAELMARRVPVLGLTEKKDLVNALLQEEELLSTSCYFDDRLFLNAFDLRGRSTEFLVISRCILYKINHFT